MRLAGRIIESGPGFDREAFRQEIIDFAQAEVNFAEDEVVVTGMMVLFNGTLAAHGTLLFASWVPHATGTVAALIFLALLRPTKASNSPPPLWSYLGGVVGAFTVMATSYTMNTALALSGTGA